MSDIINYSEFDSSIFNKKVGRVDLKGINNECLNEILKFSEKNLYKIIFIRDYQCDYTIFNKLKWNQLKLTDIKINLINKNLPSAELKMDGYYYNDLYKKKDIKKLEEIIFQIAIRSQYYLFFNKKIAYKIYSIWLSNSLNKTVADHFYILKEIDNDKIVGFAAIANSEITLIAINDKYQGKGIGGIFLNNILFDLKDKGLKECSVGTQLSNRTAINFYNKSGFYFKNYRFDFMLVLD